MKIGNADQHNVRTIEGTVAECFIGFGVGFVMPALLWFALPFVKYYTGWIR